MASGLNSFLITRQQGVIDNQSILDIGSPDGIPSPGGRLPDDGFLHLGVALEEFLLPPAEMAIDRQVDMITQQEMDSAGEVLAGANRLPIVMEHGTVGGCRLGPLCSRQVQPDQAQTLLVVPQSCHTLVEMTDQFEDMIVMIWVL